MSGKTLKATLKAAGQIPQDEHLSQGNCKKVMDGILVPPASLVTSDISATPAYVGQGNLCRIRISAASYVIFGDDSVSAPDGSEETSLELNSAGVYLVVASADYIAMSAKPERLEVISD